MARPTVLSGPKLLILVGDGGSPEVFAEPCGLTTKSFDLTASTNNTLIPDCDDPEAPAWEAKDVNSLSATVSGTGVMATESFDVWNNWFLSADVKNAQIKLDHASLGQYEGQFILSAFKLGGTRGQKVTVDLTLVNDGALAWASSAPDTTAPTITSASSGSNVGGTTLAFALTANESVTWSLIGGADQAQGEISGSTLRWVANGTQDFSSPADADANNTYVFQVRATDLATNPADQTITITVTDPAAFGGAGPFYQLLFAA